MNDAIVPPSVYYEHAYQGVNLLIQPRRIPGELNGWTAFVDGGWVDERGEHDIDGGLRFDRFPSDQRLGDRLEWAIRGNVEAAQELAEQICELNP